MNRFIMNIILYSFIMSSVFLKSVAIQ